MLTEAMFPLYVATYPVSGMLMSCSVLLVRPTVVMLAALPVSMLALIQYADWLSMVEAAQSCGGIKVRTPSCSPK
jgi:hypothetical protein